MSYIHFKLDFCITENIVKAFIYNKFISVGKTRTINYGRAYQNFGLKLALNF